MRRIIAIAAVLFVALPLATRASPVSDARARPWTVSGRAGLERLCPDIAAVNRFIQAVFPRPIDDNPAPLTDEYAFATRAGTAISNWYAP